MHNKLASSIFCAERNIHYIIGQELQNLTNILISKDFSHQSSTTSYNTKRFSMASCNKTKRFSIFIKQTVNRFLVSACPKGSTGLGLHLFQCLSADQFQVDFETQRFAACWCLDYHGAVIKSQLFHCTWGKPL